MKAKKHQPVIETQEQRPLPRFNKVIVIDNNETEQGITEAILKACYVARNVSLETDPYKVIQELHNIERLDEVPELIFVNLHMKSMKDMNFLEEFSNMSDFVKNKCKIIVLTDLADLDEKHRVLKNPCVVRYLIKPLDVFQLREFVNH